MDITAAVGERDGRKANCLENVSLLVGDKKAGYKKRRTMIRSTMFHLQVVLSKLVQ